VIVGDLRSVSRRIGVRCSWRSWDLRDPDRSFTTFHAGVVRDLRGVGSQTLGGGGVRRWRRFPGFRGVGQPGAMRVWSVPTSAVGGRGIRAGG